MLWMFLLAVVLGAVFFKLGVNQECLDCVRLLREAGADPDLVNTSGASPRALARDTEQEAVLRLVGGAQRS